MKIRIIIEAEIPDEVPGYGPAESSAVRAAEMTLADAFGEFISARYPADKYVERRYSGKGYEHWNKQEKIEQVRARCQIAEALSCRVHGKFGSLKVEKIESQKTKTCATPLECFGGVHKLGCPGNLKKCNKDCGAVMHMTGGFHRTDCDAYSSEK